MKTVILIAGSGHGAGKSTVRQMLMNHFPNARHHCFAQPIKDMLQTLLFVHCRFSHEESNEHVNGILKNAQLPGFPEGVTARKMLQQLGTECRHNIGDPDLWSRIILNKVLAIEDVNAVVIVDDWRFIKEREQLETSKEVKVVTIYVDNPNSQSSTHASEGEISLLDCHMIIENFGHCLEDLEASVAFTVDKIRKL